MRKVAKVGATQKGRKKLGLGWVFDKKCKSKVMPELQNPDLKFYDTLYNLPSMYAVYQKA